MLGRAILLTMLGMIASAPALAERQVYNPYALGVTMQEMDKAQARQERQMILGAPANANYRNSRYSRYISPQEQYEVLALEKKMKERFPVHPGLYRDAYDRGTFKKSSGGGGNPGDRWW